MSDEGMIPVREQTDLDALWREPRAVLYKHSPFCGLSSRAARHVSEFGADHADIPVYIVDVIRSRALSRQVESRLEVRHESPQAIVLRRGEVAWHASHSAITRDSLAAAVAAGPPGTSD